MITRQLDRSDLPKTRGADGMHSLHIPVLLNDEKRYIVDIHFGNDELCYLENNHGVPVKISELRLITDERSTEDIRERIKVLLIAQEETQEELSRINNNISTLRREIRERNKVELQFG